MMEIGERAQARLSAGWAPATALAAYSKNVRIGQGLAGRVDSQGSAPEITTAFRIASCTKSFTAAAVLVLRDRGLLHLDDDVRRYLPELTVMGWAGGADSAVGSDSTAMTLHMLLSMSAGLPTDDPWADRQESMSHEDFELLMSDGVRLVRQPGSAYEYSNLGYAMLGQVVERVSGVPYTTFVERELLEPLGLDGTAFSMEAVLTGIAAGTSSATGIAIGYRKKSSGSLSGAPDARAYGWTALPMTGPGVFSAIGGLFSTLDDLGRWASWMMDAFEIGAGHVGTSDTGDGCGPLSRESRLEMQTMHQIAEPVADDATVNGYGYGLVVQHHGLHGTVVGHSGGYPGFSSHMRWHPGQGAAVIGLENATYSKVGLAVRALLEDLLDGTPAAASDGPDQKEKGVPASPAAPVVPWTETVRAIAAVEELIRSQTSVVRPEIFSPNVAQDLPWDERRAGLDAALAAVGPLLDSTGNRPSERWETPASVEWDLRARNGFLRLRITMTPIEPPRVQLLEISWRP